MHAVFGENAAVAVESVLNEFAVRIEKVEHDVGVRFVRRREHNHLEMLVGAAETLYSVRPHVDSCLKTLAVLERNRKDELWVLELVVVDTVHERFVEVE